MVTWQVALNTYALFLDTLTVATRRSYTPVIARLHVFSPDAVPDSLAALEVFLATETNRRKGTANQHTKAVLRSFYRELANAGVWSGALPSAGLVLSREERHSNREGARPLSLDDVGVIQRDAIPEDERDLRDRVVFLLMMECGLGNGEIGALLWRQVDLAAQTVAVGGVGRKGYRTLEMPMWLTQALRRLQRMVDPAPNDRVVPGLLGGDLSNDTLGVMARRAAKWSGLKCEVSPNMLRTTFKVLRMVDGDSYLEVAEAAGRHRVESWNELFHRA